MTFRQNVTLLILTALLTGCLIPIVKDILDRRSLHKQKVFDAEKRQAEKNYDAALARQSTVIESQAKLLDNLAEMYWKLWKMVLKVIYYRTFRDLPERHEVAFNEYDEQSWELMGNLKAEISRAKRLASSQTHERLAKLFDRFVDDVDIRLNRLRSLDTQPGQDSKDELDNQWDEFRLYVYWDVGNEIDAVLKDLALELRLVEQPAKLG